MKSAELIEKAKEVIDEYETGITVRQLYYQLVSRQCIPNSAKSYKNFDRILTAARKKELIPKDSIVDRSKPVLEPSMWKDLSSFLNTVKASYRLDVWQTQEDYFEVWLEKDALAGVMQPITEKYGITLAIGRGYQSFTNKQEAAERFKNKDGRRAILYFGDFDPTGLDISRDLQDSFDELDCDIDVVRIALTKEQISDYSLPPIPTKENDPRTAKHLLEHGDIAVELDALPPTALIELLEESIQNRIDKDAFAYCIEQQQASQEKLKQMIEAVQHD